MKQKFKVGDLVCVNPETYPGKAAATRNFPWKVVEVKGELVTVERVSRRTGKPWRDKYHENFLKKIEDVEGVKPEVTQGMKNE